MAHLSQVSTVSIKPSLCSPQERERKQTEPDSILRYTLDNKSTAELQELLEMSTGIPIGLATEWAGLHHRNETRLDLKIFPFSVNLGPGRDLVSRRSGVITDVFWAIALGADDDAKIGSTAESDL